MVHLEEDVVVTEDEAMTGAVVAETLVDAVVVAPMRAVEVVGRVSSAVRRDTSRVSALRVVAISASTARARATCPESAQSRAVEAVAAVEVIEAVAVAEAGMLGAVPPTVSSAERMVTFPASVPRVAETDASNARRRATNPLIAHREAVVGAAVAVVDGEAVAVVAVDVAAVAEVDTAAIPRLRIRGSLSATTKFTLERVCLYRNINPPPPLTHFHLHSFSETAVQHLEPWYYPGFFTIQYPSG